MHHDDADEAGADEAVAVKRARRMRMYADDVTPHQPATLRCAHVQVCSRSGVIAVKDAHGQVCSRSRVITLKGAHGQVCSRSGVITLKGAHGQVCSRSGECAHAEVSMAWGPLPADVPAIFLLAWWLRVVFSWSICCPNYVCEDVCYVLVAWHSISSTKIVYCSVGTY